MRARPSSSTSPNRPRGNAIHGLLRNTAYDLVEQSQDSVTLAASVYPAARLPVHPGSRRHLRLDRRRSAGDVPADQRRARRRLRSVSAPTPTCGWATIPAADLTITVAAATHALVDDRMIPVVTGVGAGTHLDLRSGLRVGDLKADAALTDIDVTDGRVEHRLAAPDGTALVLWADEVFGWVQVYSPDNFPGPGLPDQRVAHRRRADDLCRGRVQFRRRTALARARSDPGRHPGGCVRKVFDRFAVVTALHTHR